MTQAFNLAQLANKVNTSGQLDASTGLVNAVPVANGGLALNAIAARSIPLANVANTYTTLTPGAGQSIRINAGNNAWEAFTPGTGTVTSVATGNGLQGGTITTTGTLSIAAPTAASIGSYACLFTTANSGSPGTLTTGTTISGSLLQLRQLTKYVSCPCSGAYSYNSGSSAGTLSGTWMFLGATLGGPVGLYCRVA